MHDNALIMNTRLVQRTIIGTNAVLFDCGTIVCNEKGTCFANGIQLPIGVEIGGRDLKCYAELSFDRKYAQQFRSDGHVLHLHKLITSCRFRG